MQVAAGFAVAGDSEGRRDECGWAVAEPERESECGDESEREFESEPEPEPEGEREIKHEVTFEAASPAPGAQALPVRNPLQNRQSRVPGAQQRLANCVWWTIPRLCGC